MTRNPQKHAGYPEGVQLMRKFVDRRKHTGQIWQTAFLGATVVGVIALLARCSTMY